MHQFRSSRHIFRLRLSSISLIGIVLTMTVTFVIGITALIHADSEMMKITIFCVCIIVTLALLHRLMAGSASCPLCHNQPMISKRCQKHRNAHQLLGSYRLRVAKDILCHNQFRCPYCGESSQCKVKSNRTEGNTNRSPRTMAHFLKF
jgi:predicted RNA-binding Zn-ribbon protein involved in translation (DUF1610 family)